MKGYLHNVSHVFIAVGILFFPVTWNLFSFQTAITNFLFLDLVKIVKTDTDLSSDSTGLYLLITILLFFSFISAYLFGLLSIEFQERSKRVIKMIAVYYLAVIMLKYGCDKLFKAQFFLPEPNLLYTPLGKLDKDILFWTSMGTSYGYNIFMGLAEVIPALLLFFRRTRYLGLLLLFIVLINVFLINLSFDISVKLFSGFLLIITGYLSIPVFVGLSSLLNSKYPGIPLESIGLTKNQILNILKFSLVSLLCVEALIPYLRSGNYNDDTAQRPPLHGAYKVQQMVIGADTLNTDERSLKRIFIHRDGYMIFQDRSEEMIDFKMELAEQTIKLKSYDNKQQILNYTFSTSDSTLKLSYVTGTDSTTIFAKGLNWRDLPLVQPQFHWTVD